MFRKHNLCDDSSSSIDTSMRIVDENLDAAKLDCSTRILSKPPLPPRKSRNPARWEKNLADTYQSKTHTMVYTDAAVQDTPADFNSNAVWKKSVSMTTSETSMETSPRSEDHPAVEIRDYDRRRLPLVKGAAPEHWKEKRKRKLLEEYRMLQELENQYERKIVDAEKELDSQSKSLDAFYQDYETCNRQVIAATGKYANMARKHENFRQEVNRLRVEHFNYALSEDMQKHRTEEMTDEIYEVCEKLTAIKEIRKIGKEAIEGEVRTMRAERMKLEEKNQLAKLEIEYLKNELSIKKLKSLGDDTDTDVSDDLQAENSDSGTDTLKSRENCDVPRCSIETADTANDEEEQAKLLKSSDDMSIISRSETQVGQKPFDSPRPSGQPYRRAASSRLNIPQYGDDHEIKSGTRDDFTQREQKHIVPQTKESTDGLCCNKRSSTFYGVAASRGKSADYRIAEKVDQFRNRREFSRTPLPPIISSTAGEDIMSLSPIPHAEQGRPHSPNPRMSFLTSTPLPPIAHADDAAVGKSPGPLKPDGSVKEDCISTRYNHIPSPPQHASPKARFRRNAQMFRSNKRVS